MSGIRLFIASALALIFLGAPAHAQLACNSPSGFLKSFGPMTTGDVLVLGPDCEHLQDLGMAVGGTVVTRSIAQTMNLSGAGALLTLGYSSAGDGGVGYFKQVPAGTAFTDSFVLTFHLVSAGSGCPASSVFTGVALEGSSPGRNLTATVTTNAGGQVVSVVATGYGGNGYSVGDTITGAIGCGGANFTVNIDTVTAPRASFTDLVGNRFQYVPLTYVQPKAFGAKFDCVNGANCTTANATDDYAALQATFAFAGQRCLTTSDGGGCTGQTVLLPYGTSLVCVSGSSGTLVSGTLLIPTGVATIGQSKSDGLKMCSTDSAGSHFITLGDPAAQKACFHLSLDNMSVWTSDTASNPNIAAVFTNCQQQSPVTTGGLTIYSGRRICLYADVGYGGAANFAVNGLFCTPNSLSINPGLVINYGSAAIMVTNYIIESGALANISGIAITTGATYTIIGGHSENIVSPIFFNDTTAGVAVTIMGVTGGVGCGSLITRQGGSFANHINASAIKKNGCTNSINNAGALTAVDQFALVNF